MEKAGIFQGIKESFCDIWSMKDRGSTLEIITPITTSTSKFVSVFVKNESGTYVVTDAGWVMDGEYDAEIDLDSESYSRLFSYYERYYGIMRKEHGYTTMFFKTTESESLLPNLVNDVSMFISSVVSASEISFEDEVNREERRKFSRDVTEFLRNNFADYELFLNQKIIDSDDLSKVNAILKMGGEINIMNYVSGSNLTYFTGSLSKSAVDFELIKKHPISDRVRRMVPILNDGADGYKPSKLYSYLSHIRSISGSDPVLWSQRDRLISLFK